MAHGDTRTVWECPFWRVDEQQFTSADGRQHKWYTARRPNPNTVHMLGLTGSGQVPLLRQYRIPMNGWVWELPAGVCDVDGESLEQTALRELAEEAGYRAGAIHHLLSATVSPGLTDELYHAYLCLELELLDASAGDGTERIEVHLVDFAALPELLLARAAAGDLVDAKILTHCFLARRKLEELGLAERYAKRNA